MKQEDIAQGFKEGISCSQFVFAHGAVKTGLERETAMKTAAAFGGGMGRADICGCVTGAYMTLGLKYGNAGPDEWDQKNRLKQRRAAFEKKWLAKHGGLRCKELLGYNYTIPEEKTKIMEKNLYTVVCGPLILSACEIIDEILAEE